MSTEVTPDVAAALSAAAIPQFKVGPGRHARLTDSERELYFWIHAGRAVFGDVLEAE